MPDLPPPFEIEWFHSKRHRPANTLGRDFVVGYVHGQLNMLDHLLAAVRFDSAKDRLFSVGDLVDRGPDGGALLLRLEREPWFYAVLGNHEALMYRGIGVSGTLSMGAGGICGLLISQ